jgi:hypothetical protein
MFDNKTLPIIKHKGAGCLGALIGKITIGIGRNLTDRGLSVDEVEMLFANDMKIAAEILDIYCHDWRGLRPIGKRHYYQWPLILARRVCHNLSNYAPPCWRVTLPPPQHKL